MNLQSSVMKTAKGRFPAWGLDVRFMTVYHISSLCNFLVAVTRLMALMVGE
jgi:hypothetical protein